MLKIGLSLSGGGYRAAAFHLGVLMYLNRITLQNGSRLLDCVNTISSVSGGSITALWYVLNEANGVNRETSFAALMEKLNTIDLPEDVLTPIKEGRGLDRTLIKQLAKMYNRHFFNGAQFGAILDAVGNIHVHHFTANASDFQNGLPFRFQATRRLGGPNRRFQYGVIGNRYYSINREIARNIKLADILAASSCFPAAFEPIVYPDDFELGDQGMSQYMYQNSKVGLMDGGIIDNLGLDSVFRAEEQLKKEHRGRQGSVHDIIIASDVSDAKFKGYVAEDEGNYKTTISKVYRGLQIFTWSNGVIMSFALMGEYLWLSGLCLGLMVAGLVGLTILDEIDLIVYRLINKYSPIELKSSYVWNLRLGWLKAAVFNRFNSLTKMSSSVVMAYMRRQMMRLWHDDQQWENRRIHNAIYMLTEAGSWPRLMSEDRLGKKFAPTREIMQISDEVATMDTTLWFTEEDKQRLLLEKLVACGQYATCWNLYRYVTKIGKRNKQNLTPEHIAMRQIGRQLREDWKSFKMNPMFLI